MKLVEVWLVNQHEATLVITGPDGSEETRVDACNADMDGYLAAGMFTAAGVGVCHVVHFCEIDLVAL